MKKIDGNTIYAIENILSKDAEKGIFSPAKTLDQLKNLGFFSCAYYDATRNVATNDYQLILSSISGIDAQNQCIGRSVNYKASALSQITNTNAQIIQPKNDPNQSEELKKHTEELCVRNKCRIHTPIYHKDVLIGAISCAWDGRVSYLTNQHKVGFSIISSLFLRYWLIANDVLISNIFNRLREELKTDITRTKMPILLEKIALLTREALNAKVLAIFQYDWYSSTLNKKFEVWSRPIHDSLLQERYEVRKFLTGTAWQDEKFRHIVDYDEFQKAYHFHVNNASHDHHSILLGKIKTIMYQPFGSKSKFFMRLMNRDDKEGFPFFTSHKIILERICDRIENIVDETPLCQYS